MIYLASKSPRRRDLLKQLGVLFEELRLREAPGRTRDVVEETLDDEPPAHYVERIARTKASVGWKRMEQRGLVPHPVLGADTEVALGGEIFGKPRDAAHAADMLRRLSGRQHEVAMRVRIAVVGGLIGLLVACFRPVAEPCQVDADCVSQHCVANACVGEGGGTPSARDRPQRAKVR